MSRIITIALFIVVFAIGAGFSAINTTPVTVSFYFENITVPLSVVVIFSMVTGALVSAFALFIGTLRLRYENSHLHKKLAVSEQEVNSLRILPIEDSHQV